MSIFARVSCLTVRSCYFRAASIGARAAVEKSLLLKRSTKELLVGLKSYSAIGTRLFTPVRAKMPEPVKEFENFDLVYKTVAEDQFPVFVYRSRVTKLSVVVVQVEGPIVEGYICVATEAHDDDGLPHTLEHLVFMGSKKYPSKYILPKLGNRFLSCGTNAWTDVDHTCYTMETAGSEGFCKLLPIFLDHVMRPVLTDSAFMTEVHHINGEGENTGVVYGEMQARENTGLSMVYKAGLAELYPGRCGYKSCTGGRMKNLRESTSAEKVRDYHKSFYRPENVWVAALGHVDPVDVLRSVAEVERDLIKDGLNPEQFVRPWQSPIEPLERSVNRVVEYPADEEDNGMCYAFWRGPLAATDSYKIEAVTQLMDYMTSSAVSPFRKAFVEIPSPLASSVSCSLTENSVCALLIAFSNVPLAVEDQVPDKIKEVIRGINVDTLDIKRLRTGIHRRKLRTWVGLENSAHSQLANDLVGSMLYGMDFDDLKHRLNVTKVYDRLYAEEPKFWVDLLNEYFSEDKPVVVVRGRPSIALKQRMEAEEKARVEEQKQKLGEAGLAACAEAVNKAVAENEAPYDMDRFKDEQVPDTSCLHFHSITQYSNFPIPVDMKDDMSATVLERNPKAPHFDLESIPVRAQVDDVNSKFVRMRVIIDASQIDPELRIYATLFKEIITASGMKLPAEVGWDADDTQVPVKVLETGETYVPFEALTEKLERDTVYFGSSFSPAGYAYSNYFDIYVIVEQAKYVRGLQWLRDLLLHVVFEPERALIIASKMAMSVSQQKKSGSSISAALKGEMNFKEGSYRHLQVFTRQQAFLQKLADKINEASKNGEDGAATLKGYLAQLEQFRQALLSDPTRFFVHMSADLESLSKESGLENLEQPWVDILLPALLKKDGLVGRKLDLTVPFEAIMDRESIIPFSGSLTNGSGEGSDTKPDPMKACVVGMGSVESAFLWQAAEANMDDYLDPDLLPLLLLNQYLNQEEGPFWETLRGRGLTYSYGISAPGLMIGYSSVSLSRSPQIVDAYRELQAILKRHLEEGCELDANLLQTARSGLMFDLINSSKTVRYLSQLSVVTAFKRVPINFDRHLLKRIHDVTPEQMLAAGRKHLSSLLDTERSRCAIVCHPSKMEEICVQFAEMGWNLAAFNSVEDSILKVREA